MRESMSTATLQELCFSAEFSLSHSSTDEGSHSASPSDFEIFNKARLAELQTISDIVTPKVTRSNVSRQGRDMQRWEDTNDDSQRIRLVTGAVPILSDSSILLVSSGKKPKWILPKGGWEADECLEESALREAFEEAGCSGVLGPPLQSVLYERNKTQKRRTAIEAENTLTPFVMEVDGHVSPYFGLNTDTPLQPLSTVESSCRDSETSSSTMEIDSCASSINLISPHTKPGMDTEESSPCDYTHIRMVLFPLYIKEVKESWPESGRLRKALPIDDAIAALASRPELRSILQEVKEKNLHLVSGTRRPVY